MRFWRPNQSQHAAYEQQQLAQRLAAQLQGAALCSMQELARHRVKWEAPAVLEWLELAARQKIAATAVGTLHLSSKACSDVPKAQPACLASPRLQRLHDAYRCHACKNSIDAGSSNSSSRPIRHRSKSSVWPAAADDVAACGTISGGTACSKHSASGRKEKKHSWPPQQLCNKVAPWSVLSQSCSCSSKAAADGVVEVSRFCQVPAAAAATGQQACQHSQQQQQQWCPHQRQAGNCRDQAWCCRCQGPAVSQSNSGCDGTFGAGCNGSKHGCTSNDNRQGVKNCWCSTFQNSAAQTLLGPVLQQSIFAAAATTGPFVGRTSISSGLRAAAGGTVAAAANPLLQPLLQHN